MLPRKGVVSRSSLYAHYVKQHFLKELKHEFGRATECFICKLKVKKWVYLLEHMGRVHDKVEKYLPEEAKIPREKKKRRSPIDLIQSETAQFEGARCKNPAKLLTSDQAEVEKDVCPTRMYRGQQYDFRCIYCKVLPREGRVSRSELYRHYAVKHFGEQLKSEYGNLTVCPICGIEIKIWNQMKLHVGQVHDKVEKYLPEEAKIPRGMQQPWGKHASMKTSGVVGCKATKKNVTFPSVPESSCYNIESQGKNAVESDEEKRLSPDIVDGFTIEEVMVVEEEEALGHPHSYESLKCAICEEKYSKSELNQAVKHLEELHGVRGLGLQLNLGLSRLISAGYLLRPAHTAGY